ncbi:MAG: LPS assembly lipoprotein LptE, partial [Planctomycetota bacterium]
DEVRARTAAAPVALDAADRVLGGTIVRADEQVLSEDLQDRVVESSAVITVRVTVRDRAAGSVVRTYSLTETEPFSPRAGRVRDFDQAVDEALRDLAEQIVYYGLEGDGPTLNDG